MLAYSGNRVCAPLARFEILAAIVAAVALIGCSGVGTPAPATDITGSLTPRRAATNALSVDWTLSRECAAGGVEKGAIKGVSSGTATTETHALSGTSGTVTFSADAFSTEGATVSLACGDTTVVEKSIAAPATTGDSPPPSNPTDSSDNRGSLALSRGGDYNVTAAWSLTRACARSPQLRATATGSTADIVDLTGTSGSESLSTAKYRNVSATVELRCDGVVLATKTIAAPTGTLTLTRGSGDSLEVAWALNPSCSAGKITVAPADGSEGDSRTISGTGGNVDFTDGKYKSQGASVTLDCNGARMATETIAAPAITGGSSPPLPAIAGTLTLSRGGGYNVTAAWSLSETCARNPRIRATASGSTADIFNLTGTSGSQSLSTAKYRNASATVELRCDGVVLATETIAAPTGRLTPTRGTGNSVKVAWTLNPSCAAGTVTTSPDGETQTHDFAINGTSGNVETTASAYTTKGAAVKLKCNDAEIASASILAPITGTLTVGRGGPFRAPFADWTLSRECPANGTISASAANGFYNNVRYTLSGTSGNVAWALTPSSVTVTLSCEGRTLATATIPAQS